MPPKSLQNVAVETGLVFTLAFAQQTEPAFET